VAGVCGAACLGLGNNCDDGAGCCEGLSCTSPDNQNFTCTAASSSSAACVPGPGQCCSDDDCDLCHVCDDAGTCVFDAIDPACHTCGNGTVEAWEECDDGNTADGDGCDMDCHGEFFCCDAYVPPGPDNCYPLDW
jgi:large repetitive protein